ncbi:hypothetical protein NXS19_002754 [Fusarium pseudograminearum]|uniref:HNH nuclease domain-containing protein n=1 Tax=Fusarium pseudograminearum (strain CS3096) TaxID=1028729 RepID=K3VV24_FUSPC|nr:hypothetical protein FPSE_00214 [Fusarium pseudograminearum CS3096]EKJ79529.1 hypothetical protein FPSE_00214 [Fusarium pseudograminearum CS3096]UZP34938.1 hypothetical protein NXS19_002754 [Fusarium pseudograminearum]
MAKLSPLLPTFGLDDSDENVITHSISSFPIHCLREPGIGIRYEIAKDIVNKIKKIAPMFCLRIEHLVAILLVTMQDLQPHGHLSPETCSPYKLKERLCAISPFCKHYMLHLDPENLIPELKQTVPNPGHTISGPTNPKYHHWSHAIPKQPNWEPQPTHEMSPEDYARSMYYNARFRTAHTITDAPARLHIEMEQRRIVHDRYECVVTGRVDPRVFWFIPRTWNDTKDHNDATGNIRMGCMYLTKINLLDEIHSATELHKTHKLWNMISVDSAIYDALTLGLCAFKYIGKEDVGGGNFWVHLKLFWMPELTGRFNKPMDQEGTKELSLELNDFQRRGCPIPKQVERSQTAMSTLPLWSGKDVFLNILEADTEIFEHVVTVHWACATFTALCGGAGRAWFLTGMNQEEGWFQPRDEEFSRLEREAFER